MTAIIGIYLIIVGGAFILAIGLASLVAAVAYSGGPYPLSSHGLGDLFAFVFFGLVAVVGTYYVADTALQRPGALRGDSHWRAHHSHPESSTTTETWKTDARVGKRTLAVMIGYSASRVEYILMLVLAYGTPLALWLAGQLSPWVLLSWLSLPLAVKLVRTLYQSTKWACHERGVGRHRPARSGVQPAFHHWIGSIMTFTEETTNTMPHTGKAAPPRDPYAYLANMSEDELEKRWFHKFLVLLDAPTHWPAWRYGLAVIALASPVSRLRRGCSRRPPRGQVWLAVAMGRLPDHRCGYPWQRCRAGASPSGQFTRRRFSWAMPRLLTMLLAGAIANWTSPVPPLLAVLALNLAASGSLIWGAHRGTARYWTDHPCRSPPIRETRAGRRFGSCTSAICMWNGWAGAEERLLQLVQEVAPDIIVLTGDYVNLSCVDDPVAHEHARQVLSQLSAPRGVFAVLGSPPVDRNSAPDFDDLSITLLRDEFVTIDVGDERKITLLGLDCSHHLEEDEERLHILLDETPAGAYRLLLYHSPDLMPAASQAGVDLYLCGHTHGGQIRLPLYGAIVTSSRLGKQFEMGHYEMNGAHLYVSRGVGLEGLGAPRIRFLCPPKWCFSPWPISRIRPRLMTTPYRITVNGV